MKKKHKIIVAVTGASGAIYAKVLFDKLLQLNEQIEKIGVLMSNNAKFVWEQELGNNNYDQYPFVFYKKMDFMAPFASGSANYGTMIICLSSMGTMGRIASGISNDLTTRAADVILKERRKLIIVARETPLSLIHINNMKFDFSISIKHSSAIWKPANTCVRLATLPLSADIWPLPTLNIRFSTKRHHRPSPS